MRSLSPAVRDKLRFVEVSNDEDIDMRLFPDFFLIGPQRTGSTWLFNNLSVHPQISMPANKELYYFNNLVHPEWHPADLPPVSNLLSWYLDHFRETELDRRRRDRSCRRLFGEPYRPIVRGEATATYAAQLPPEVIDEILLLNPDIKAVMLVRNPVDRAWSHAKKDLPRPRRGQSPDARDLQHLESVPDEQFIQFFQRSYQRACGGYSRIIRLWRSRLREGHLYVGRFDDILAAPDELLLDVFRFLGVDAKRKYLGENVAQRFLPSAPMAIPAHLRAYLLELFEGELQDLAGLGFHWEDALRD